MHNFNQQCRNKNVIGHSLTENFDRKNKNKDAIKEILIIFSLSLSANAHPHTEAKNHIALSF